MILPDSSASFVGSRQLPSEFHTSSPCTLAAVFSSVVLLVASLNRLAAQFVNGIFQGAKKYSLCDLAVCVCVCVSEWVSEEWEFPVVDKKASERQEKKEKKKLAGCFNVHGYLSEGGYHGV